MQSERVVCLRDHPELADAAAKWFHQKWGVPQEAYAQSISECLQKNTAVPQWYLVMNGKEIIAGIGVIENDFHNRKDLAPNVCAVYVEEAYRNRGIAGRMLQFVCDDLQARGVDTLYLITDLTSFYERYGWEFLCMAQGDGEQALSRIYLHKSLR